MAFNEFCCRSGGSNMNGGHIASNGEPATSAVYSATNGGWNSGTGVFTPTSGNPSLTVTVGDYGNVFTDGATTPVFIARVTAVNSTTITLSTTAKSGTAPTTAGTGISINVGGAWAGPSGTVNFPFGFFQGTSIDASSNPPRVNFKSGSNYAITAAIADGANGIGPTTYQGYTTTFGDGGKAIIDGGTSGASYVLYTASSNGGDRKILRDIIFQNNGATGSATGVTSGDPRTLFWGCVVNNVRGNGFDAAMILECEAYACNQSNTANSAGIVANAGGGYIRILRCISHDNAGSNNNGFYTQVTNAFQDCISESNGLHGFFGNNIQAIQLNSCDAYNNGGDGLRLTASTVVQIDSCNFIKNGGWGVNATGGVTPTGMIANCGFGTGTQANTSGDLSSMAACAVTGTVNYGSNLTPWVDPANGDFRINLAAAKNAGRGVYTETAASYAGTIGYPDIGAAQHLDSGGGGGTTIVGVMGS